MSSQNQGINLIHQPHETGYRLLELPPDLANLLESDTPPVLTLEDSSDTWAVLRTPTKSYHLKQKNTSNALFLLSPSHDASAAASADAAAVEPGLAIVSTIHETVELSEVLERAVVEEKPKPAPAEGGRRGKWHEMFGKGR